MTLLHPPYTAWHLSYIVLGAAAAPAVRLDHLGWTLLAFFLAVGLSAHSLDELHGHPLGTRIPNGTLLTIAAVSLTGALAIGAAASVIVSLWIIPLILFGVFIVPAYNLEWWSGRFHSDIWFGLSWGAFPALVGYWVNAVSFEFEAFLVAGACFLLSLTQRKLSNRARVLRRTASRVTGSIEYQDGRIDSITLPGLVEFPESPLRFLSLSIPLLALGWLVARL